MYVGWIAAYPDHWIRYAPLFRAWTDLATIDPSLLEILRQTLTLMSDALERQIGSGVFRTAASTRTPPAWRSWPCWIASTP